MAVAAQPSISTNIAAVQPLVASSVSGHVFRRPGKRRTVWVAKWRDAFGQQHKKVIGRDWTEKGPPPPGYLREKDAQARLEAILTDARRGAVEQLRTGLLMEALCDDWIAFGIHERDWKPSTLSDNRSVVNAHIKPFFGDRRPERINADDIEDWRDTLVDERGISRRTANKVLTIIGAVLERGRAKHGLVVNVARDVPKLRVRYDPNQYDFFTPDEVNQLVAAALSEQDGTLFLVAAFTGLRLGELLALCWRDVDFDEESLHVYNSYALGTLTAPKSGLSRTVPMSKQVIRALKAHKRRTTDTGRDNLVFGGERGEYLDSSALRRRFKKALKKAKLRQLRFHDLRHTFGTIAVRQATIVQVQHWMGHADIQTTMKYTHHRSNQGDAQLLTAAFEPKKKRKPVKRTARRPKPKPQSATA